MRKFLLTFLILGSALAARSQTYGLYQTCTFTNSTGQAINGAQVYFLTQPANTVTLTPLASVYSTNTGGALTQPLKTDGYGSCTAYLSPGLYTVCFNSPYTGKRCFADQAISLGSSGVLNPSPQFSMFYQPNSGSSPTGQGDPNATTDGSGNVKFNTIKSTNTGLTPSTAPICPNGTGGAFTTSGCAAGGGTVNPGQLAFAQYPTSTASSVSPSASFTYDAATGKKMSGPRFFPGIQPLIDASFYGLVADHATDNTTALTNSLAAASNTASSAGEIWLDCQGGCNINSASSVLTATTKQTTLMISGEIYPQSTLVVPNNYDLKCAGGTAPGQFIWSGQTCRIHGPQARGTLGTAISSTDTPVTFTPTYTLGSTTNLPVSSSITIAETESCPATLVTRTFLAGTFNPQSSAPGNVTATFAANACTLPQTGSYGMRIPTGALITISGCSDSTLNSLQFATYVDYPARKLTWKQAGAATTATGCTIVGFNEDTLETVRISADAAGVKTATFVHKHDSSAQWGAVAIASAHATLNHHGFYGITVSDAYGAAFWGDFSAGFVFKDVNLQGTQFLTSMTMELAGSYAFDIEGSSFQPFLPFPCPESGFNCSQASYPYGLRITALPNSLVNAAGIGGGFIRGNSTISGGIKLDANLNGVTAEFYSPLIIKDSTIEQPIRCVVCIDPRITASSLLASEVETIQIDNAEMQDNRMGYVPSYVDYTDQSTSSLTGMVNIRNLGSIFLTPNAIGKYYNSRVIIEGHNGGGINFPINRAAAPGSILDGIGFKGEIPSLNAGLGFSLIPHSTLNVVTNPASWVCSGTGCSIVTGILGPGGGTTSAGELRSGSSGATSSLTIRAGGTAAGDWYCGGIWTRPGVNQASQGLIELKSFGGDVFDNGQSDAYTTPFSMNLLNDWWHPISICTKIVTGNAASHAVALVMHQDAINAGSQYAKPFGVYLPAIIPTATLDGTTGVLTSVSSTTNLIPGMACTGTGIAVGSEIDSINAGASTVTLNLPTTIAGSGVSVTCNYADDEVQRWRQDLFHGVVPPNMPAGGDLLAIDQNYKLYWGSDTNLYRSAAGVVKTDGSFDSTNGPLCAGATGSSGYVMTSGGAGAPCSWVSPSSAIVTNVPPWLTHLGTGADGANTSASGGLAGVYYYTNFTVPFGNTVTVSNTSGLTIHATGTCTIAGTITQNATNNGVIYYGASSGGSGGGTLAGSAGTGSNSIASAALVAGGTAGASSGGNGGNGTALTTLQYRAALDGGLGQDGLYMGGAPGKQGGSSGGAGGNGAPGINLICGSITGTDGTHTGTIDASGKPGINATANSTGGGSGGAGGSVILSSHAAIATPPNIYVTGGAGAVNVVPQAVATLGSCTTQPIVSLGVTAGAFSSCSVVTAGSGCGTGTGITWKFQGGGGTQTTAAIVPTFSGGALASCTVTAGDSAGYTASTFTTSGNGGQGANGWTATFTW